MSLMLVQISTSNVNLPKYQSIGAAAMDFEVATNTIIAERSIGYIPTGCVIATPVDHGLFIFARASLHKKSLMLANSVGLIDSDYRGKEDEITIAVVNMTQKPITVEKGERIAQFVIMPTPRIEWIRFKPESSSRGGFGSTGEK